MSLNKETLMNKAGFSEEQIVGIFRDGEGLIQRS
jgi:hypothetical protein